MPFLTVLAHSLRMNLLFCIEYYIFWNFILSPQILIKVLSFQRGTPHSAYSSNILSAILKVYFKQYVSHDRNLMENVCVFCFFVCFCIIFGMINMGIEIVVFLWFRSFWTTLLISSSVDVISYSQRTVTNIFKSYVFVAKLEAHLIMPSNSR